jgi:hypothetical protein
VSNATTDAAGQVSFRGFYGRYAVRVHEADGTVHAFSVAVSKKTGQENRFRLTVGP